MDTDRDVDHRYIDVDTHIYIDTDVEIDIGAGPYAKHVLSRLALQALQPEVTQGLPT